MAERLTPQQRQAVVDRGGKLLVSAAAGSGKTKVLVDRLLGYLTDPVQPANIDDFLIITYTKAAAAELRGKIAAKLNERIAADPNSRHLQKQLQRLFLAKISTVHSFCADILHQYAYRLDIPVDFRVADENEGLQLQMKALEQVLEDAYDHASDDPDFCAFIDTQGFGRDDRSISEIILSVYHKAKCHLSPEDWLGWCVRATDTSKITDAAQTVWGKYLVDDLMRYLDLHMASMERCTRAAAASTGMEKPAILLDSTLDQLRALRCCTTWDEILTRKTISYGTLTFSKKCEDPVLAESIKAVRNACKEGLSKKLRRFHDSSAQILGDINSTTAATRGLVSLVLKFSSRYDLMKRSRHMLDFSDLEHKTLDLFLGKSRSGPTAAAAEVAACFREVMVDEYQDSNAVQDAIFNVLTHKRQNCFMVGDVKQSIYQFRLADPGIFLEKYHSYVPAEGASAGQGRKVLLSSNFRSGGGVISAVNDVFSLCMSPSVGGLYYTEEEALHEGIPHIPLQEAEIELHGIIVQNDTYAEEAAYVADRICELLDGTHMIRQGDSLRPICENDIVILLRSPGSVGMDFKDALEGRGVRCVTGSTTDLLQTEEIEVLRSILQIISNPLQDIPLIAAMGSRVFGFSADTLAALRARKFQCSYYEAVLEDNSQETRAFLNILTQLRSAARMLSLSQLLNEILRVTALDSIYASLPDGDQRSENLQYFYQLAAGFENTGYATLESFLDHLAVMEDRGLSVSDEKNSAGAVTIMSIHKSKGLEFPVVFLCGLSKTFNMEDTHAQVLCHKELGLGLSCVDSRNRVRYPSVTKRAIAAKMQEESVSEEMRVLYVAMTRAQDRLIMTYASKYLDRELNELAARVDLTAQPLLTMDVRSAGEWILYAALHRAEAVPLFSFGNRPKVVSLQVVPWKICVQAGNTGAVASVVRDGDSNAVLSEHDLAHIRQGLSYSYPHAAATQIPSKQTVTQLKGRYKDQEAAEGAQPPKHPSWNWREPAFARLNSTGRDYGSAMHAVMQYIRFEACGDENGVRKEVARLTGRNLISAAQAELVDCDLIAAFFATEIGTKLQCSPNVLREFKFSLLDNAGRYETDWAGEHVLLQGVIDCALIEDDGITIVDFKTDRVTEETLPVVTERYRAQVEAYAYAMEKIYERPVKSAQLYFFRLGRFVELS